MIAVFISAVTIAVIAFVLYLAGILAHTFARAGMSVASPMTPMNSLREYLWKFWPKLIGQWFLGVAMFFIVWDNTAVFGLLQFPAIGNKPLVRIGLAMVLGWFSDSVMDTLLGLFHITAQRPVPPDQP